MKKLIYITMAFLSALISYADVHGTLYDAASGKGVTGMIRYLPASKLYVISINGTEFRFPPSKIGGKKIDPPPTMAKAVQACRLKQYGAAIPALKKIVSSYAMLQWDVEAAPYLAKAYLDTGKADEAVDMCEKVIKTNPDAAFSGSMSATYCSALVETKRFSKLETLLPKIIANGGREGVAQAQVIRGDMEMKKGNYEKALIDGYLRTAVLFKDFKDLRAEALYKASKCFTELGKTQYAEKMRKTLISEHSGSKFAQMAKSGS